MNRISRTLALAATAIVTTIAVFNASIIAQAAPTSPTPSAPTVVQPMPLAPQIGGMSRRVIDLNKVIARPDLREPELHPLLASDDLKYPHDVCYGMITCCNSAWVQGCDAGYFEEVCTIYGGEVVLNPFSDGSINYECHEA